MSNSTRSPVLSREPVSVKVAALRAWLVQEGMDGFVIPHDDAFQNEYTPAAEERLAFVSGFTGSAGVAVVLREKAALFVDGRYTLQAPEQTDSAVFDVKNFPQENELDWAFGVVSSGARLGFDPWLHSVRWVERAREKARARGVELVAVSSNPVDALWADRPAAACSAVEVYPLQYAGEEAVSKRLRLAGGLRADRVDGFVITRPDSLMWLLNIRGRDVASVPLALGYGVLHAADGSVDLFIKPERFNDVVRQELGEGVRLHAPDGFLAFLADMVKGKTYAAEFAATPEAVVTVAGEGGLVDRMDPCVLPKACKNKAEIDGMHSCHVRDGIALVRFMRWLSEQPVGGVDELAVEAKLRELRAQDPLFRDASFETIAGSGANGAVVHYRASARTNRAPVDGEFMVLDSGGQYLDGTTDVTRTVIFGDADKLTPEMKDRYTRVLKGHIALARVVFPKGTCGEQLDGFARQYLWQAGLDYQHGTGHGVGCYLSVHEGPARISRPALSSSSMKAVPLAAGMVLSNEPGYYKAGAYGIRHENLQVVVPVTIEGAECEMLGFEPMTLCPFDIRALMPSLLTQVERDWLNAYHARIVEELSPLLSEEEANWLWMLCGVV